MERLAQDEGGDLIYTFTQAWSDGTRGIQLSPLELLEKLAALIPPPRVHQVRYGGCLAAHSNLRRVITPTPRQQGIETAAGPSSVASCALSSWRLTHRPSRRPLGVTRVARRRGRRACGSRWLSVTVDATIRPWSSIFATKPDVAYRAIPEDERPARGGRTCRAGGGAR